MIIWLASFPRSGNTFFRVLLNSVFGIKTYSIYDDRYDIGANKTLREVVGHEFLPTNFDLVQARVEQTLYFIKTHDYPATDHTDKVIYLLRDGRESTLSYCRYLQDYTSQKKSLREVINGDTQFGTWGQHVAAWAPENAPDTLLVRFEELIRDPLALVPRLEQFAGIKAVSEQVPSFDELHRRGPKFFRSGKTDSWKAEYSQADHLAFWLRNYSIMRRFGYTSSLPPMLSEAGEFSDLFSVAAEYLCEQEKEHRARLSRLEARLDQLQRTAGATDERSSCKTQERTEFAQQAALDPTAKQLELQHVAYTDPRLREAALQSNRDGEVCFKRGDVARAEAHFLQAVQSDPGIVDAYNAGNATTSGRLWNIWRRDCASVRLTATSSLIRPKYSRRWGNGKKQRCCAGRI